MKNGLVGTWALVLGPCAPALAPSSAPGTPADESLKLLKDGNARQLSGQSDSRAPLECIFAQGVGDLLVLRVRPGRWPTPAHQ